MTHEATFCIHEGSRASSCILLSATLKVRPPPPSTEWRTLGQCSPPPPGNTLPRVFVAMARGFSQSADRNRRTPAFSFCHSTLTASSARSPAYSKELSTLGNHLLKRLDFGLLRKEVAQSLEVDPMSINYWEDNRYKPSLRVIPQIVKFGNITRFLQAWPDHL